MPIKPLFKDEEAVAVWAWTSVPVLHSTRVRFEEFLSADNVAVIFILIKIALYLINIFTGSQSWNRQHQGQTIYPTEELISMNLFKILCVMTWA